jgi:hypothetical protein
LVARLAFKERSSNTVILKTQLLTGNVSEHKAKGERLNERQKAEQRGEE